MYRIYTFVRATCEEYSNEHYSSEFVKKCTLFIEDFKDEAMCMDYTLFGLPWTKVQPIGPIEGPI